MAFWKWQIPIYFFDNLLSRDISTGGIENKSQFHTGAGDEVETLEAQQVAKEKADQDARNKPTVDPHSGYIIESRPTSIKDYLEKVVTKQDLLDRRPKEWTKPWLPIRKPGGRNLRKLNFVIQFYDGVILFWNKFVGFRR